MFASAKRLSGVVQGYDALVLAQMQKTKKQLIHLVPDDTQMAFLAEALRLVAPHATVLIFPAWDTVPYDRSAPKSDIVGTRIETLMRLLQLKEQGKEFLLLATIPALMQRIPPMAFFKNRSLSIAEGEALSFDTLKAFLISNGYHQTDTVLENGEYAIRGGIIDIFPAGFDNPVRLDFFGDEIDSLRFFDALTQRTTSRLERLFLMPMAEFSLTPDSISRFRTAYRTLFDRSQEDIFYESVSSGRYVQGLEHFLPLFYDKMATLLDYAPDVAVTLDFKVSDAVSSRFEQIMDYYDARKQALLNNLQTNAPYHPIPPELFFLSPKELEEQLASRQTYLLSPFLEPNTPDMGGRAGKDFVDVRLLERQDVMAALSRFIRTETRRVIVTAATAGSVERLRGLLREQQTLLSDAETWTEALKKAPSLLIAPFEKGFSSKDFIIITETDLFGERILRTPKKRKKDRFIEDLSTLNVGDLVVHQTHGIGRFEGLRTLQIGGAAHDCLCLVYEGEDRLFVPVENADILSRYGSAEGATLDRLGSSQFKNRKERVKKDLFEMAGKLIEIASARAVNHMDKILAPHGLYQEFCARFPYAETEDQLRTIQEIETDFASGRPMDRLVCGDVGFGKTEIAMRAAFLAVMSGYQVAVVVPTTLLARQHTQNFRERFQGFPVRIGSLSRLVSVQEAGLVRQELQKGTLDIVIGTHALLSKGIQFNNLGLVIIDEEQHFGVAHKERLKELKAGVHVLTLSATPIPRTLQLSLSGVRELSIIATPPIDRLAVKTFVMPFDAVIVKEAILREQFRGGQVFFVCPRISDMSEVVDILKEIVPDARVVEAHGQMSPAKLEQIMTAFADRKYDVLVATSIIESGLDMPAVNTMIVYRADMFGLAALYQLRGRVGRGKLRAYAYLTTPPCQRLGEGAQKRLNVMQSLDSLGAGFLLASHDLDIRGAGNLLGDDQSGHIKEIGVALYQKMLSEAIFARRSETIGQREKSVKDEDYSPQISIGLQVLIPDTYIKDLDIRMALYHRISDIKNTEEIDSLRAELVDRFGPYPKEVDNLLITIHLKLLAKQVNIEKLDAGTKGASISFHNNTFPNPAGLISYISSQMGSIRIRPDQKLLIIRPWGKVEDRLQGIEKIMKKLAEIAAE